MKRGRLQCKDIPDLPILFFLSMQTRWSTHCTTVPGGMPSVLDAMPREVGSKLACAKMNALARRGLVGPTYGSHYLYRGDWEISAKGRAHLHEMLCDRLIAECGIPAAMLDGSAPWPDEPKHDEPDR